MNDLTISTVERQNVLNNKYAVANIQNNLGITGMLFEDEYRFTKKMVADFYEVDISTINRYLAEYEDELKHNGYVLCKGKHLKDLKLQFGHLINETSKTTQLGLFNFRAFLNIGMLLTESEKAKQVRSVILDIVIATINEKAGGGTKYINRRDVNYLPAAITEENYRKNLTSAINQFVFGHQTMKYAQVTDFIYKAIVRENAREYRKILKLQEQDVIRHTLYAEVLLVVSSFENGVAAEIEKAFHKKGSMLSIAEVEDIVSLRDALHDNLAEYIQAITPEEFEKFIGAESIDFDKILQDNQDVLMRLKQAEE